MNLEDLLPRLRDLKIIPVIALESAADAVPLGKALMQGGIPAAEITFRSNAAEESIRRLRTDISVVSKYRHTPSP